MEKFKNIVTSLDNAVCIVDSIKAIAEQATERNRNGDNVDNLVYGVMCLADTLKAELVESSGEISAIERSLASAANALV